MSTEQNKDLVRRSFEAINSGDFAATDSLFAPEYRLHVSYSPVPLDREAAVASWGPFFAAFPNLHHAIEHIVAEGEWVVAEGAGVRTPANRALPHAAAPVRPYPGRHERRFRVHLDPASVPHIGFPH